MIQYLSSTEQPSSLFTHGRAAEATHRQSAILIQPQPPLQNTSNPLSVIQRTRNFHSPLLVAQVASAPVRTNTTCCWQGKHKQRFVRPSRITGTAPTPRRLKSSSLPSPFPSALCLFCIISGRVIALGVSRSARRRLINAVQPPRQGAGPVTQTQKVVIGIKKNFPVGHDPFSTTVFRHELSRRTFPPPTSDQTGKATGAKLVALVPLQSPAWRMSR